MCLGELISITCTHDNIAGELTRWAIHGGSYPPCTKILTHEVHEDDCLNGPPSFTHVSDKSGSTLTSTAEMSATNELDGTVVECYAGGHSMDPQVGNVTLYIIGELNSAVWFLKKITTS